MARGFLINYNSEIPPVLVNALRVQNIPSVWTNSRQTEAHCVFPDDFGAAREAAEHFIALGHRRIAYVAYSPEGHYSMMDRRSGYWAAMTEAGHAPEVIYIPSIPATMPHRDNEWAHLPESPDCLCLLFARSGTERFLLDKSCGMDRATGRFYNYVRLERQGNTSLSLRFYENPTAENRRRGRSDAFLRFENRYDRWMIKPMAMNM